MSQVYPLIIANRYESRQDTMTVFHKYTGEPFAQMSAASVEDVDTAVVQAKHALEHTYFDVQTRYQVLMKAADLLKERREELAAILTAEAGKTVQDAHNEVDWSVDLFVESAEEAKRLNGETFCMPVPWLDTRTCYTRREPVGVVVAITPFNFPLNLVAHKVAPALAAGNPVILKPAAATSVIGWKLCEILIDAGLPAGFISCLTGSGSVLGPALAAHPGSSRPRSGCANAPWSWAPTRPPLCATILSWIRQSMRVLTPPSATPARCVSTSSGSLWPAPSSSPLWPA